MQRQRPTSEGKGAEGSRPAQQAASDPAAGGDTTEDDPAMQEPDPSTKEAAGKANGKENGHEKGTRTSSKEEEETSEENDGIVSQKKGMSSKKLGKQAVRSPSEPAYLSKGQKSDNLYHQEWIYENTKAEFTKHAFAVPDVTPSVFDFIPKQSPWGPVDLEAAKTTVKECVLEHSEQLLDETQEIYRVESNSPPRYAWRKSREYKGALSMEKMSNSITLQAMQAQFQEDLQDILSRCLAEHAEKTEAAKAEAAAALAALKLGDGARTSSKDTNAKLRGGEIRPAGIPEGKKSTNEKDRDSWSVPSGEPVWGGSGGGVGSNGNKKRNASGAEKSKGGK